MDCTVTPLKTLMGFSVHLNVQLKFYNLPFADTTLSIIWSFFFWITSIIFVLLMIHFAVTGNYERVWHGIAMSMIFINFQLIAGLFQVLAALILDFDGAKLRYLMFSPIYLLFTWIVNPLTIVTTCLKAIKAVMGYGSGKWVSPERKANSND